MAPITEPDDFSDLDAAADAYLGTSPSPEPRRTAGIPDDLQQTPPPESAAPADADPYAAASEALDQFEKESIKPTDLVLFGRNPDNSPVMKTRQEAISELYQRYEIAKRTNPDGFNPADVERNDKGEALPRDVHLQPGVIIDNLLVGEEIGLIDSNRPNPNLIGWRAGQLKAIAAGIGAGYSSIARSYDGTYSAQRQELVEQWVHYAVLADEFTSMFVQPHYERFVEVAHLSGVVPRPTDVSAQSADDALYLAQSMPWIDPLKEVQAWEKRTQAGFASEVQAIRAAGGNPRDVLQQISEWRAQVAALNLRFSSDAATPAGQAQPQQEPQKASE